MAVEEEGVLVSEARTQMLAQVARTSAAMMTLILFPMIGSVDCEGSVKAAYVLTDSAYNLAVSDKGGKDKEGLGSGFIRPREGVGRDGITRGGSAGRGRVKSEVGIRTRIAGVELA